LGRTSPCTPKSAISLSLRHCHANPGSLVILFQVRNSVRPMHLFGHNRDHDYYFKLPVKGSGMPNQLLGVLLHTLAISGLSRVRTELFQLLVIPSLAPHPVHAIRQSPRHRDLGNLPASPHRQVEILTAPFLVAAHRDLRRFHQQEAQQPIALFRDVSQPGMVGSNGSRSEIGARSDASRAHLDHNGNLRADRTSGATPSPRTAFGVRPKIRGPLRSNNSAF
jgi:hypothetical protein